MSTCNNLHVHHILGLCIYLVLEYIKGERHLQFVSGVSTPFYWITAYLWDMMVFLVPIGLSLLLMFAFKVPAFYGSTNMLAVFMMMMLYA